MSILDINDLKKESKIYIGLSIFCVIFSLVYEMFSHGVISYFMILSFLFPFFGYIVNKVLILKRVLVYSIFRNLFDFSLITFTFGSIIKGFLDIYGTTNSLIYVYPILGIVFLLMSILSMVVLSPTK